MERVESVVEFDKGLNRPKVILFAFAAWSGPAYQSRQTVDTTFKHLQRTFPMLDISLLEIDLTEQEGEIWDRTGTWLTTKNNVDADTFMYSGAGSVAWIRDGNIVDSVVNAHHTGAAALVDRSVRAFECKVDNGG
jgi:hypothetical protein